jgi:hypothetical protein
MARPPGFYERTPMADPPTCSKCGEVHWPFNDCPRPEPTAPSVVAWPAAPEGFRDPGFGTADSDMLSDSLSKLGFGAAPATIGYTRPRKRS